MVTWHVGMTLDALEREVILKALKHFNNNKTHTANALGIAIRTIDNKLEKYNEEDLAVTQRLKEIEEKEHAFLQAQRGIPVEPVDETPKEHAMHLREPKKVQEVLSADDANRNSSKRVRRSDKE